MNGKHGKVKSTSSDRVYLVLSGKGFFEIDGERINVEKDDVVIVPKNTPYDYGSTDAALELFLVHTPAYNRDTEVRMEPKH